MFSTIPLLLLYKLLHTVTEFEMDLIHFHFHFHNEINQSINRRVLNLKLHIAGRCVIFAVAGFRDFWVRH